MCIRDRYYVFLCYIVFVSVRQFYEFKYFKGKLGMTDMYNMVMGNVYLNSDGNQGNNFEFWYFKVNKNKSR